SRNEDTRCQGALTDAIVTAVRCLLVLVIASSLHAHPRLLLAPADIPRLRTLVHADPTAARWWKKLEAEATKCLEQPPAQYLVKGDRLLEQSRLVLRRVYLLGLVYLIDDDPRYLDRARREMAAACSWPDWHPTHFLDTAELAQAL